MAITDLTLSRTPAGSVYEGGEVILTAHWHNSGSATQVVEIDWGDGSHEAWLLPAVLPGLPVPHTFTRTFSHYFGAANSVAVIVRVSSGIDNASSSISFSVSNVAPTITASGDLLSDGTVNIQYNISDPGSLFFEIYYIQINWGDGSSTNYVKSAGAHTSSHTYAAMLNKRLITISIVDSNGQVVGDGTATYSFYPVASYYDIVDDSGSGNVSVGALITYYDTIDSSGTIDVVVDGTPFYDLTADGITSSTMSLAAVVDFTSVLILDYEIECSKVGLVPFEQLIPQS